MKTHLFSLAATLFFASFSVYADSGVRARVLRSKKPKERIGGLSVPRKAIEVIQEGSKTIGRLTVEFEPKGRTLVVDELLLPFDEDKHIKQKAVVKVLLNKEVIELRFMATGKRSIETEKIIVVSKGLKKNLPEVVTKEVAKPVPVETLPSQSPQVAESQPDNTQKVTETSDSRSLATEPAEAMRESKFQLGAFEIAPLLALQSGGYAVSTELSWNPQYSFSQRFFVIGNLGLCVLKAPDDSRFLMLDAALLAGTNWGTLFLEAGPGIQNWANNAGARLQLAARGGMTFLPDAFEFLFLRASRLYVGYSLVTFQIRTHEFKVGLGFDVM